LGVDGGGSKTACCLLADDGTVVAEATGSSLYYLNDGIDLVGRVLRAGIAAVCDEAGITVADIAYSFIAVPCYGEVAADIPVLDAIPRDILGSDRYVCGNDMIPGWAGSLGATDGINIIAGTGSMTYGEWQGASARTGGWGELFGDEGSGYWTAIAGLNAFTRMCDGRLPAGPLVGQVRADMGLTTDFDVIDIVLNRWHGDRAKIAGLSRTVAAAADAGDAEAIRILNTAADELMALVVAVADIIGCPTDAPIPLSWSGGMFTNTVVREAFTKAVAADSRTWDLRDPLLSPHYGAALYAARLAGHFFTPEQLHRLDTAKEGK
jgi:N-acetylglucosamine kinase-like BadF-type ATPase